MIKSCCGMDCKKCKEYPHRCLGCHLMLGQPVWAREFDDDKCPVYTCCADKQYSSCEECNKPICHIKEDMAMGGEDEDI